MSSPLRRECSRPRVALPAQPSTGTMCDKRQGPSLPPLRTMRIGRLSPAPVTVALAKRMFPGCAGRVARRTPPRRGGRQRRRPTARIAPLPPDAVAGLRLCPGLRGRIHIRRQRPLAVEPALDAVAGDCPRGPRIPPNLNRAVGIGAAVRPATPGSATGKGQRLRQSRAGRRDAVHVEGGDAHSRARLFERPRNRPQRQAGQFALQNVGERAAGIRGGLDAPEREARGEIINAQRKPGCASRACTVTATACGTGGALPGKSTVTGALRGPSVARGVGPATS